MLPAKALMMSKEARPAFLEEPCERLGVRRADVQGMIDQAERATVLWSASTADVNAGELSSAEEVIGSRIGPYRPLQLIGEGGFGSVYVVEQEAPVQRKVALKIIKLGMDTRQVVARFEQERQAPAMMDHPGIAKVFDGGPTRSGRPYFVMELVHGEPVTAYRDKNNFTMRDRLELFRRVCQAVRHAHSKGVIHRHIKPSNVLVAMTDGKPVRKVIDFGVAKATGSKERPRVTAQRLCSDGLR